MNLTPAERETVILFSDADDTASVYTHDKHLIAKLRKLHQKHPEKVYPYRKEHPGAVTYIVPKSCVSIREPYSEERRRAASERAKNAGYRPPVRTAGSKSD